MTPAARTQAAIELLDAIIAAAREGGAAADTLIARYFAQRRYAGLKDRRAVRELVYSAIRRAGETPVSGRAAVVGLTEETPDLLARFDGSAHGPAPVEVGEPVAAPGVAPAWLVERLAASGVSPIEQDALVSRAPLDLRVNRLRADPDTARAALPEVEPIAGLADALRVPTGTNVEALSLWRDGGIEVQDAGSQWVTLAAEASAGMQVVDLCAGAGGKSLALAAAMAGEGELLACDIDRARLSRLAPRAARAGVSIVETRLLDPGREVAALEDWHDRADLVFVDAPCSGTGTWRRNPEARWRLTPDRLARLIATQQHVLAVGAPLVRPGGALVYVVCSLLDEEGAGQVDRYLATHSGWTAEPLPIMAGLERGAGRRLTPGHDSTDGFFVARLRRA